MASGEGLSIALLAGEASGDLLGGAIAEALKVHLPGANCLGVTGPRMRDAGCESIEDIESLSVMGLGEVIGEVPRLLRLRASLRATLRERRTDLVVGIDAPDFNLGLEKRLRADGLRCAHVVSPTVWAWRPGRTRTVARSTDALLTLLPFEARCYADEDLDVRYIGHPLADTLSPGDAREARETLGLALDGEWLAMLPGSRGAEVARLMPRYVAAGNWLLRRRPELRFAVPLAKESLRAPIEAALADADARERWTLVDGQSRAVVTAADAVLVASGTATLECLLLGRPMAVAYHVAPVTEFLLRKVGLLTIDRVSLPNLLAGEDLVPELLQDEAEPEILGSHLYRLLTRSDLRLRQTRAFERIAAELRCDAAAQAARVIAELCGRG